MKKLIAAAILVASSNAMADAFIGADEADVSLKGNIAPVTAIATSTDPGADALDLLAATPAGGTKIATVTEVNNVEAGYTVTIASENDFKLLNSSDTEDTSFVPYGLIYKHDAANATLNGGTVPAPNADFVATHAQLTGGSTTISDYGQQSVGSTRDGNELFITFAESEEEELLAGDHTDVLTLSIAAK